MFKQPIQGTILNFNRAPVLNNPVITMNGTSNDTPSVMTLDENILSRHLMLIGGTGCGKTNTFFHIVNQIKTKLKEDDVMIVFDTKGDYFSEFFNEYKDCVISASSKYKNVSVNWNIFSEALVDGPDLDTANANIDEITWGLFSQTIENNKSNPFFPNAARDLFASILKCSFKKVYDVNKQMSGYSIQLNNVYIRKVLDTFSVEDIIDLLNSYEKVRAVKNYIGDGKNGQGLGVLAEMQNTMRQILVDKFAERGDFSVSNFVRQRGGRTLFIEYDLSRGATLLPLYKLLIDLALKEAMGRNSRGNVYVICDEFKLLPSLQHIDDAVNFGRSLGVKIFAGLQSIDQIIENYGESRGKNIIAGFSSVFSFKANDENTRKFTTGLYGKNYILEQHRNVSNQITEEKRIGDVVEDWDISCLRKGEAIIGLSDYQPFKFRFEIYNSKK